MDADFGAFLKKREQQQAQGQGNADLPPVPGFVGPASHSGGPPMPMPDHIGAGNVFTQQAGSNMYSAEYQSYGTMYYGKTNAAPGVSHPEPGYFQNVDTSQAYSEGNMLNSFNEQGRQQQWNAGMGSSRGMAPTGYGMTGRGLTGPMGDPQSQDGGSTRGPEAGYKGGAQRAPFNDFNKPARGRGLATHGRGGHDGRPSMGRGQGVDGATTDDYYREADRGYQAYDDNYASTGYHYDQYSGEAYISSDAKECSESGQGPKAVETPETKENKEKDQAVDRDKQLNTSHKPHGKEKADDDKDSDGGSFVKHTHNRGMMGTLLSLQGQSEGKEKGDDTKGSDDEKFPKPTHSRGMMGTLLSLQSQSSEEKKEGEKAKEESSDEEESDEDDEKSEAVKKLPPSHNRGLMSTLINMIGPEAVNRKPDPLPPPQPMKLKPKDQNESYLRKKMTLEQDWEEDEEEYQDVMDLPVEERDLNPDDFTDNIPGANLYCKYCNVQTTSENNFRDHLDGKNHRAKMSSIASGKIVSQKLIKSKVFMQESQLGKKSWIMECLKANQKKEPMLGLSFITEFQSVSKVMCVCNLCGVKFDHNASFSHISGAKHRFQYMKEKRPMEYAHLKRFGGKKSKLVSFLLELSLNVEREDGRGKPVLKAFENGAEFQNQQGHDQKEEGAEGGQEQKAKEEEKMADKNEGSEETFYNWVETEYKKSREARMEKRSPSPPPGGDRFGQQGPPFNRGYEGRGRPGFNQRPDDEFAFGRRDEFSRHPSFGGRDGPPRNAFGGPHGPRGPPNRPFDDMRGPPDGRLPPSRHPYDQQPFDRMGRDHYPPPPHHPQDRYVGGPYGDRPEYPLPPGRPGAYPGRDPAPPAPLPPHLDPDPIRRLDALRKARAEQEALKKDTHLDPDPLKRVRAPTQGLDPDPLKRLLKRDMLAKATVIDYSHGGSSGSTSYQGESKRHDKPRASSSRSKRSDSTWEDDIENILGQAQSKKPDSLGLLSNTYSSPERQSSGRTAQKSNPGRPLPFSKSYLDLPENKKKLRDLKEKARSPPIPGLEKIPKAPLTGSILGRTISISSSSISSASPSPVRDVVKRTKSPSLSKGGYRSRSRSPRQRVVPYGGKRSPSPLRRRSPPGPLKKRSPSPYGRKSPIRKTRSPNRHKASYSPVHRKSPFLDRSRVRSPPRDFKAKEKSPPWDRRRKMSPVDERTKARLPFMNPHGGRGREASPPVKRLRDISPQPRQAERHGSAAIKQDIPHEEASVMDDSEDAQAERIADMLLKMSSSLNTEGDTQATLQALLANPEMAKTILEAQSSLEKQPPREEKVASTSSRPSRPRPAEAFRSRPVKKPEPPPRERVAFSLSGGRSSLAVSSSAFNQSSSDEEET